VRLEADAPNMSKPGAELIARYLDPDRLPVSKRWSRKHAHTQRVLCERFAAPVIAAVTCQDIKVGHMQKIVNSAPSAGEGDRIRRMISALVTAGVGAGYLVNSRLKVHWQAGDRPLPATEVTVAGESAPSVDSAEIPSDGDIGKLGHALAAGVHGRDRPAGLGRGAVAEGRRRRPAARHSTARSAGRSRSLIGRVRHYLPCTAMARCTPFRPGRRPGGADYRGGARAALPHRGLPGARAAPSRTLRHVNQQKELTVTANEAANKALVMKVLTELFENRDGSAIDRYYTDRLIQHNPLFADGTDELRERVTQSTTVRHQTSMVAADGDIVMVYGRYEGIGPKPMIAVDIYRIEDGRIAEHWDVLQEEVSPTASGHPMYTVPGRS